MTHHVTQQTYDEIAEEFTRRTNLMPEAVLHSAERFVQLLGSRLRVLDVGCGPGRDLRWMQSRGKQVFGVDLSVGMLRQARAQVLHNLSQMDMMQLAVHDTWCDGLWCNAALLHVPKQIAPLVLREFRRVLTSEGLLFLALQEGLAEGLEQMPDAPKLAQRYFARYQMPEVESLLQQNGFHIIELARYPDDTKSWLHALATIGEK